MKYCYLAILLFLGLCSCSFTHVPDGEYAVFSYRQTQQAMADSAFISNVPIFVFEQDEVRIRGDFGKAHFLNDTLYKYSLRGDRMILDNGNEIKEYRFRLSENSDRVYLDIELLEEYIQELTLASVKR